MNWIFRLFRSDKPTDFSPGTRINTVHGMGTIVSGNLIVLLDKAPVGKKYRPNNKSWTFNIGGKFLG